MNTLVVIQSPPIIGVTGTRHGITDTQAYGLHLLLASLQPGELHHGDCLGADDAAHRLYVQYPLSRVVIHPPDVDTQRAFCGNHRGLSESITLRPAAPYLVRNRAIVDACDLLIACPRTHREETRSGTWATVRYARSQNKPILIIV